MATNFNVGQLTEIKLRLGAEEKVFVDFFYSPWGRQSREQSPESPEVISIRLSHGGQRDIQKFQQAANLVLPRRLFDSYDADRIERLKLERITQFEDWGLDAPNVSLIITYFKQAARPSFGEDAAYYQAVTDFLEEVAGELRPAEDEREPFSMSAWPPQAKFIKIKPDPED